MAPEMFTQKNVAASPSLDVWALGCILYIMIVGRLPFRGDKAADIKTHIVNDQPAFPPSFELSEEVKHLIGWMLDKNMDDRARIFEISDHAWTVKRKFTQEEKDRIKEREMEKLRLEVELREKEREIILEEKKASVSITGKSSSSSPEKFRSFKAKLNKDEHHGKAGLLKMTKSPTNK